MRCSNKGEWMSGLNTSAETKRQGINLRIAILLDRALVGLLLVLHLNVVQHFHPTDNLQGGAGSAIGEEFRSAGGM